VGQRRRRHGRASGSAPEIIRGAPPPSALVTPLRIEPAERIRESRGDTRNTAFSISPRDSSVLSARLSYQRGLRLPSARSLPVSRLPVSRSP
jgi:hypothetical protein